MTHYTVTSDRVAGHNAGDTVTDDDLAGANVPALIAAGHLTVTETNNRRRKPAETEGTD
jgi:hypothetical protein